MNTEEIEKLAESEEKTALFESAKVEKRYKALIRLFVVRNPERFGYVLTGTFAEVAGIHINKAGEIANGLFLPKRPSFPTMVRLVAALEKELGL